MHLCCAEGNQSSHLRRLVLGVEVEVYPRRNLERRTLQVERDIRACTVLRAQQDEIDLQVVRVVARDLAERGSPELAASPRP